VRPVPPAERFALAEWVAGADGTLVLPLRHAGEAHTIATPLELVDSLDLAPSGLIAIVHDADGRQHAVPLVQQLDYWRRARGGDGVASALAAFVLRGESFESPRGRFVATRWVSDETLGDAPSERAIDVDQTNESVVVGDQVVVKWAVRPSTVPGPAPDRLAALVTAGFTDMPTPWGLLRWHPDPSERAPLLVATVVAYLPDARDGWEWAVEDVRALAAGELSMADAVSPWPTIGDLVARLHLALPERRSADDADAGRWSQGALAELAEALEVVDGPEGTRLREHAPQLREIIGRLGAASGTALQDVHGDLHVGQILRWQAPDARGPSYAVTDFDGNPVLSADERVAPAPAAADVAGLIQSVDHVGRVVSHRTDGIDPDLIDQWITAAQVAVLASYQATLAAAGRSHLFDESLLPALRARQVVREYLYAARHLPHWRYVPHAALPALARDGQTPGRPVHGPADQA
jgi:maltokinase